MIAFDPLYLLGLWRRDRRGPGLSGELEPRKETWSKPAFVLILLHILGSAWSQSEQLYSCPAFCECSKQAETVKCVNKNLTVLPRDFPPYVRTLFITGNRISSLHEGAFKQLHSLEKLTNLNFSGNHLQELGSNVFSDLPNLTQLDLSNNLLENVSSLAFQGAANGSNSLIELNLSNTVFNESLISLLGASLQRGALKSLSRLELAGNNFLYLPMGMFDSLPSLKHLDLHNNSLLGLQPGIFTKLKQLETLDLSSNSFKFLKNNTLFDLPKQPGLVINFNNNSWVCDCQIDDFASWLNESTVVKDAVTLMCSSPEKMNATPIVSIKLSELECYDNDDTSLQTSYVFLGIVLALIGVIFLLVLYLNRKGIKKWIYNIRDACRDHMEGYHYRYEINADPRLTNLNTNSDV